MKAEVTAAAVQQAAPSSMFSRRGFLTVAGGSLLALGGVPLLTSCGPSGATGGSTSGASDELTILTPGAPTGQALKDAQKFGGDPIGVTLKYQTIQGDNFASQLSAAQQAGRIPDLIQQSAGYVPTMLAAGIRLEPLDDYAADDDRSDFYDADYAAGTAAGTLYLLSFSVSCRAIAYRSDWAEEGAAGTPPDTWSGDEFGEFAAKLSGSGRAGFGWEAKTGDPRAPSNWIPLLWSTGAEVVKGGEGEWETGFSAKQFESLMQFYSDMIYKYKATPTDVGGWGYPETDGGFNKSVLASYSSGPFVRAIVSQTKEVNEVLAAAPLPNLGTPSNFFEGFGFAIHADSPNKDKAWEYIQNIRGQEFQDRMVATAGNSGPGIRRSTNAKIEDPYIAFFPTQFDIARPQDPIDIQPINNSVIMPAMQKIALQNAKPSDVANEALEAMKGVLAQLNGS